MTCQFARQIAGHESLLVAHIYIVMVYIVMAYIGMAYIVMAYIGMAYIVMANIVMAYIVMARLAPTSPYIPVHMSMHTSIHTRRVMSAWLAPTST